MLRSAFCLVTGQALFPFRYAPSAEDTLQGFAELRLGQLRSRHRVHETEQETISPCCREGCRGLRRSPHLQQVTRELCDCTGDWAQSQILFWCHNHRITHGTDLQDYWGPFPAESRSQTAKYYFLSRQQIPLSVC